MKKVITAIIVIAMLAHAAIAGTITGIVTKDSLKIIYPQIFAKKLKRILANIPETTKSTQIANWKTISNKKPNGSRFLK